MYYKDKDNQLHFLDSIEFEYLLPISKECQRITDEEAADILRRNIQSSTTENKIEENQ